jgi:ABC-type lipoprotein release transport system permease subunit
VTDAAGAAQSTRNVFAGSIAAAHVSALAIAIPALRAARVLPSEALRGE